MRDDNRALATNTLLFFGTLVMAAALMLVLQEPGEMLISTGQNMTETNASAEGYRHLEQTWSALPWFLVLLAFVSLIADAAAESDV